MSDISDPFRDQRNTAGVLEWEFQGESVPMILRHADVGDENFIWRNRSLTDIIRHMNIGELIVKTPGTCGGRARIAGHRIPVFRVARAFRAGQSPEEMLVLWPSLNLAEIHAAIAYALANAAEVEADLAAEERAWAQAEGAGSAAAA
jgi:uncharacterized protein (DUF433 family)